jgi:hypothetical protein
MNMSDSKLIKKINEYNFLSKMKELKEHINELGLKSKQMERLFGPLNDGKSFDMDYYKTIKNVHSELVTTNKKKWTEWMLKSSGSSSKPHHAKSNIEIQIYDEPEIINLTNDDMTVVDLISDDESKTVVDLISDDESNKPETTESDPEWAIERLNTTKATLKFHQTLWDLSLLHDSTQGTVDLNVYDEMNYDCKLEQFKEEIIMKELVDVHKNEIDDMLHSLQPERQLLRMLVSRVCKIIASESNLGHKGKKKFRFICNDLAEGGYMRQILSLKKEKKEKCLEDSRSMIRKMVKNSFKNRAIKQKLPIRDSESLIWPFLYDQHYYLIIIHMTKNKCCVMDSLGWVRKFNKRQLSRIGKLAAIIMDIHNEIDNDVNYDIDNEGVWWKTFSNNKKVEIKPTKVTIKPFVYQNDGYNCGLWVILFAHCICNNVNIAKLDSKTIDMNKVRIWTFLAVFFNSMNKKPLNQVMFKKKH